MQWELPEALSPIGNLEGLHWFTVFISSRRIDLSIRPRILAETLPSLSITSVVGTACGLTTPEKAKETPPLCASIIDGKVMPSSYRRRARFRGVADVNPNKLNTLSCELFAQCGKVCASARHGAQAAYHQFITTT